jgi:hypothetical protein
LTLKRSVQPTSGAMAQLCAVKAEPAAA